MRDISYKVALGGIVSALCLVTMFLAGILPAFYLILPMIAGVLLMLIAAEVNTAWAMLTYLSVSILSMFITFDKEAALVFILIFGHYPIIRPYIQKIPVRLIQGIIKLVIFNLCALAYFYLTVYIFGIKEMLEEFEVAGKYGGWLMLGFSDVIFVLYDINLSLLYKIYRERLLPRFRRRK